MKEKRNGVKKNMIKTELLNFILEEKGIKTLNEAIEFLSVLRKYIRVYKPEKESDTKNYIENVYCHFEHSDGQDPDAPVDLLEALKLVKDVIDTEC